MKEETTYGLSPGQILRLLAIGLHTKDRRMSGEASRTNYEMLHDMLRNELPLDPAMPDSVPAVLNRPCEELSEVAGQTLGQVLTSPQTDLGIIRTVKDYAKALSRHGANEPKHAAAIVIHYWAIASALVFHGEKITRHSDETVRETFLQLTGENRTWTELRERSAKARAVCRQQKHISE